MILDVHLKIETIIHTKNRNEIITATGYATIKDFEI